jgi:hypothetical protein
MKRSSILRSATLLPLIVLLAAIATLLASASRLPTCKAIVPQWRIFAGKLALVIMFGTPIHAWADDAVDLGPRDEWSFHISPYVWAAGLEGTVAAVPGLPSIEVDASFKDILENLDLAAMAFVELRYGKIAGYADIIYTKVTADAETPAQLLFDNIEVESTLFIGTFGAAYRPLEAEEGFLDLLMGARAWSVDTRLNIDGGTLNDQEIEDNQNWVDPVIGVKGLLNVGAGFYLNGFAHVGGFGAASDLTWDVFGGIGYQFNDTISAVAGYRHLEVDYDHGGFIFDVEMSGPVIGAIIRF